MTYINSNINWEAYTDGAILEILGNRIKQIRLNKNITQQQLANTAGVDRTTIYELENNGRSVSLKTFVQIMRALDKLNDLTPFLAEPEFSPSQIVKMKGKKRQRAYTITNTVNYVREKDPDEW
jgi:putative transcriptional regulator